MVNLTNKFVASIKPPRDKKYIRLWDSNISGFGLRVTDKGVKSFIFEGRQGLSKKTKQVKIGRVGEMSVAEARTNAAELSRKFRSGEYEKLAQKRQSQTSDVLLQSKRSNPIRPSPLPMRYNYICDEPTGFRLA